MSNTVKAMYWLLGPKMPLWAEKSVYIAYTSLAYFTACKSGQWPIKYTMHTVDIKYHMQQQLVRFLVRTPISNRNMERENVEVNSVQRSSWPH